MIPLLKFSRIHFVLATGICSLLLVGAALGQQEPPAVFKEPPAIFRDTPATIKDGPPAIVKEAQAQPEKARALLDQVKKSEQDRQIAVKQTEIDRLKEDQAKIERDSDALNKTIESTTGLTTDANDQLATLTMESRQLKHELAVAEARISAEKLKIEGLRALSEAQGKSLSALARRAEEAAVRSRLHAIEMEILQAGKQVPGDGREGESQTDLVKARKALAAAEAKTESDERLAHDAMKAAAARMTLAETSATTAQQLADNDFTQEATAAKPIPKAEAVKKPAAEKPAPVAAGPKSAATKPTTNAPATTTKKTSKPGTAPARR